MKLIFLLLPSLFILCSCEQIQPTDHSTEGSALEATITRQTQRIIRYDCKGEIFSDRVETNNSVSKQFFIVPKKTKDLIDFSAVNETTGKRAGHLVLNLGVFTLDLAPTIFNINAKEGMNKISWNFVYKGNKIGESGITFIHVRENRVFDEKVAEIKPTIQDCQK